MFKRLQGFVIGFMACALLFGGVAYAAELNIIPNPFPVLINGTVASVEGYNINGYTFLKLGDFKQAGLVVKFNETDKQIEITNEVKEVAPMSDIMTDTTTTTPYRNPLSVDSSTPPETIDGLSVYTVDGVQYIAADTKKDTAGKEVTGFKAQYFENNTKYFIMYMGKTFSLRKYNPETEILSIPADKQHALMINDVLCFEYNYYKNTIELLIKPVEEPQETTQGAG